MKKGEYGERRKVLQYVIVVVCLLLFVVAFIFGLYSFTGRVIFSQSVEFQPFTLYRELNSSYIPGNPLIVSISIIPNSNASAYVVEDQTPSGWTVSNISSPGVFDSISGKVKWGVFFDGQARNISYVITPTSDSSGDKIFYGRASFDGQSYVISGNNITSYTNPGNSGDEGNTGSGGSSGGGGGGSNIGGGNTNTGTQGNSITGELGNAGNTDLPNSPNESDSVNQSVSGSSRFVGRVTSAISDLPGSWFVLGALVAVALSWYLIVRFVNRS